MRAEPYGNWFTKKCAPRFPDDYELMDPELVRILKAKVTPFLPDTRVV